MGFDKPNTICSIVRIIITFVWSHLIMARCWNPLKTVLLSALLIWSISARADEQPQSILQMLDYIGVDYPKTVTNRTIVNQAEYAEQVEFAGQIKQSVAILPAFPEKDAVRVQASALEALVASKEGGDKVATVATEIKAAIIRNFAVVTSPKSAPDLRAAASLFQQNCASCHGVQGKGDGPLAATLQPKPADFHDGERQAQRSIFGLYNTISVGVKGTAMSPYKTLTEDQRWALAFYVSQFSSSDAERRQGQLLWSQGKGRAQFPDLKNLVMATSRDLSQGNGDDAKILAYLRANPDSLKVGKGSPLQFSSDKLRESLESYRNGDVQGAYQIAVAAYLEGFELAEAGLATTDPKLRTTIESGMYYYRNLIKQNAPVGLVIAEHGKLQELLATAENRMQSTTISPGVGFASALGILLREGLEAVLILAAIIAFLTKTGRRDALPYIHAGWIAALLLGIATWFVASYIIDVSGASRELTEGVTALLAATILLYVSFWLLNKLHIQHWKNFIESKVRGALSGRTLWLLAAVSFIAVYREVFETVLFYETLWAQVGDEGSKAVLLGIGVGALLLVVLAWAIFRLGVRLPLRLFFGVSSGMLYILAIVFAGKGVAALQEAGKLPISVVDLPRLDLLGIYPNMQSLGLQALLVVLALGGVAYTLLTARKAK
jgi:high-affinity iron transporter